MVLTPSPPLPGCDDCWRAFPDGRRLRRGGRAADNPAGEHSIRPCWCWPPRTSPGGPLSSVLRPARRNASVVEHSVRDLRTKSGNGVEEVPAKLLMLPRQSDTLHYTKVTESFYPNQDCVITAARQSSSAQTRKSLLKFASEEKSEETL